MDDLRTELDNFSANNQVTQNPSADYPQREKALKLHLFFLRDRSDGILNMTKLETEMTELSFQLNVISKKHVFLLFVLKLYHIICE